MDNEGLIVNSAGSVVKQSGSNSSSGGSKRRLVTPASSSTTSTSATPASNQFDIALQERLVHYDERALIRSCETLAFLVRDAAHVTPHNFDSCVHCLRVFVEASINGGITMVLISQTFFVYVLG